MKGDQKTGSVTKKTQDVAHKKNINEVTEKPLKRSTEWRKKHEEVKTRHKVQKPKRHPRGNDKKERN